MGVGGAWCGTCGGTGAPGTGAPCGGTPCKGAPCGGTPCKGAPCGGAPCKGVLCLDGGAPLGEGGNGGPEVCVDGISLGPAELDGLRSFGLSTTGLTPSALFGFSAGGRGNFLGPSLRLRVNRPL